MSRKFKDHGIDIKKVYCANIESFDGFKHKKSDDLLSILSSNGKVRLKMIPFDY